MNRLLTAFIFCFFTGTPLFLKAEGLLRVYTLPCGPNNYTIIPVVVGGYSPPYTLFAADGVTVIAGPQTSNVFANITGSAGNNFVIGVQKIPGGQPAYTTITLNAGTTTINGQVFCPCLLNGPCYAAGNSDSITTASYLWTSPSGATYTQSNFLLIVPNVNGLWTLNVSFTAGGCNYNLTNSFILSNCFPSLPIKLNYFRAAGRNCSIKAEWSTALEQNTDRFEIEISENENTGWAKAATVKAAGNSSTDLAYSIAFDADDPGVKFLRLQEIDLDGRITYSQVVKVDPGCKAAGDWLAVVPSLIQQNEIITIKLTSSAERGVSQLVVTDILGRQLFNKNIIVNKLANQYPVSLSSLGRGVYFASIINPATGWKSNVARLVIQ